MKESEVLTIRIPKDIRNQLGIECEIKNVSLNNVITNVLLKHVKWDRFAQEMEMISIPKAAMRIFLSKISDNDLSVIAASVCRTSIRNAVLFLKDEITIPNTIAIIGDWLANSWINYKIIEKNDAYKFIISHELGTKYSHYFYGAVSSLISEIGCTTHLLESSENTLMFLVNNKKNVSGKIRTIKNAA